MAFTANNSEFIMLLLDAFGLNGKEVKGFTLRAYVDEIVTLQVTQYAQVDGEKTEVLKKYVLTKEEIVNV